MLLDVRWLVGREVVDGRDCSVDGGCARDGDGVASRCGRDFGQRIGEVVFGST